MNLGNSVIADLLQFSLGMTPEEFREKAKQYFVYTLFFNNVAAGGADVQSFTTRSDSWFVVTSMNAAVRTTAAGAPSVADRPFTVQIEEAGGGRNLFSNAADFDTIFGTAQLPGVMGAPFFVKYQSTMQCSLTSLAAVILDVRLSFVGFKVFNSNMGI